MAAIAHFGLLLAALAALAGIAFPAVVRAAPPLVYLDANDDGVPGPSEAIAPNQTQILHLYIDGGATPSAADTACVSGSGDELCAWQLTIEASGELELLSFTPAGDAVHSITSARLRSVGGDAIAGTLGPVKVGDLSVEAGASGELAVTSGKAVGAALALRALDARKISAVPEPAAGLLFAAAFASLFSLARRRSRHAPALVALLLFAPALAHAADTDADGVDDAEDNCPYWSNPGQSDVGGFDSDTPDGIGDACQCGDVSGDGIVDLRDVARIDRAIALLAPALVAPQKCPADTSGVCTTSSFDALREALVDPETGLAQSCLAANPLPNCGNAQLDFGEQCDDDTVANGACCSASCTLVTGACDDGDVCTTNGQCNAGVCNSIPVLDNLESNDSIATARFFGTIPDDDDYPNTTLTPTLHPDGDVDWFRFQSSDETGVLAPRADLSGIPAARDYDLCIYYDCDDGGTANVDCSAGNPAQRDGRNGCCSRNAGNASESVRFEVVCGASSLDDDSGGVFIVVEKFAGAPTCAPYSLSFGDD
jgi:hypothetical protein